MIPCKCSLNINKLFLKASLESLTTLPWTSWNAQRLGIPPNMQAFKKIMAIAIRTSHYIFCQGNKNWDRPNLVELKKLPFFPSNFFPFISRLFSFQWPIVNYPIRGVCSCILVNIPRNEV